MKLFFNLLLLLSLLVSIGTGTTSVWHCLKNNTLSLSLKCAELDKQPEKNHCCAKASTTDVELKDLCCEELEQAKLAPFNLSSDLKLESSPMAILAFNCFNDLDRHTFLRSSYPHSKAPPKAHASPPLFKLHCSFLC